MKTTTNYGFKKPESNDPYNIEDFNESFELIDTVLKAASDKADTSTTHPSDMNNPHQTTAEQVGLGNVPNVATNDQTPTYVVATENAALSSGEKLSVAFGKIAKAVSSLISHLADTVGHITAAERTSWNAKADASGTVANADTVDNKHASDFLLSSIERVSNANADDFTNGTVYAITGCTNVPTTYLVVSTNVVSGDGYQLGYGVSTGNIYTRAKSNNVWNNWENLLDSVNAGTLEGKHASDFLQKVPTTITCTDASTLDAQLKTHVDALSDQSITTIRLVMSVNHPKLDGGVFLGFVQKSTITYWSIVFFSYGVATSGGGRAVIYSYYDGDIHVRKLGDGGNADTLDGLHASSFIQTSQSAKVIVSATAPSDTTAVWIVPS